jgi:hypothetical protein
MRGRSQAAPKQPNDIALCSGEIDLHHKNGELLGSARNKHFLRNNSGSLAMLAAMGATPRP